MNQLIVTIFVFLTVVTGFTSPYKVALTEDNDDERHMYTKDGFNLDLDYITPNFIAMKFPYPNTLKEVKRFLDKYHKDHYLVINLRLEDHVNAYTAADFEGHGVYFGFQDNTPPDFELLLKIIGVANGWLQKDPKNVIAVHCKAGWGRTGTIISSELLYSGINSTAKAAYDFFALKRGMVPILPSQKRYVGYLETYLKNGRKYNPVPLVINSIRLGTAKSTFNQLQKDAFGLKLTQGPERKVSDLELKETKKDAQGILLILKNPVKVDRDFRLDFLVQNGNNKQMKMYLWLNTAFIDPSGITLSKSEVDDAPSMPSDLMVTLSYTSQ